MSSRTEATARKILTVIESMDEIQEKIKFHSFKKPEVPREGFINPEYMVDFEAWKSDNDKFIQDLDRLMQQYLEYEAELLELLDQHRNIPFRIWYSHYLVSITAEWDVRYKYGETNPPKLTINKTKS